MGNIKKPQGVDFIINSRPLTKEEEIGISNYIKNYKEKKTVKSKPISNKGISKTDTQNLLV